jgi:hypothetical protein
MFFALSDAAIVEFPMARDLVPVILLVRCF